MRVIELAWPPAWRQAAPDAGAVRDYARRAASTRADLVLIHPPARDGALASIPTDHLASELAVEIGRAGGSVGVTVFADLPAGAAAWDRVQAQAAAGEAVARLAAGGVALLAPAAVRLPALTGEDIPLPLARSTAALLRRDLGWDGVVGADVRALRAETGAGEAESGVSAIAAGADVLLGVTDPAAMLTALTAAAASGELPAHRVSAAARRALRLQESRIPRSVEGPAGELSAGRGPELAERPDSAAVLPGVSPLPAPLRVVPPAEAGMNAAALARVDAAIEAARQRGLFTTGALAVARDGRVVRLRGYGTEPGGEPVDPHATLFDVASLTKVMATTAAVARLIDQDRMALDAPVRRYLPDFTGEEKERVTVRHLLAHTSGLPPGLWLYGSTRSPEQALRQTLRQPLRRSPGERAEYSDLGMIVLAAAVEAAAEEPMDRFLAREIFLPLGMASTMFVPPLAFRDRTVPAALRSERPFVIHGVVHDGNAFRLGGVTGHAGLFSTAADVLRFGQAMLDGGTLGGVRVLEESTVRTFVTRQRGADTRALGWDTPADVSSTGRFFSARSFGHTGFTGTSLWVDPQLGLVVVLLTNRTYDRGSTPEMQRLRRAVHEGVTSAFADRRVPRRPGSR
jgi:serine-type D-Ala-D-Ala carboxypeptidase